MSQAKSRALAKTPRMNKDPLALQLSPSFNRQGNLSQGEVTRQTTQPTWAGAEVKALDSQGPFSHSRQSPQIWDPTL